MEEFEVEEGEDELSSMPDRVGRWGGHSFYPPNGCEHYFLVEEYRIVDNTICKYTCSKKDCEFHLKWEKRRKKIIDVEMVEDSVKFDICDKGEGK